MNERFFRKMDQQDAEDEAHLQMIYAELRSARVKHPKLADKFTCKEHLASVTKSLNTFRFCNGLPVPSDYGTILMEEYYESIEAYLKGDKKACLQELAQVGAVLMRMMDYVEKNGVPQVNTKQGYDKMTEGTVK